MDIHSCLVAGTFDVGVCDVKIEINYGILMIKIDSSSLKFSGAWNLSTYL